METDDDDVIARGTQLFSAGFENANAYINRLGAITRNDIFTNGFKACIAVSGMTAPPEVINVYDAAATALLSEIAVFAAGATAATNAAVDKAFTRASITTTYNSADWAHHIRIEATNVAAAFAAGIEAFVAYSTTVASTQYLYIFNIGFERAKAFVAAARPTTADVLNNVRVDAKNAVAYANGSEAAIIGS